MLENIASCRGGSSQNGREEGANKKLMNAKDAEIKRLSDIVEMLIHRVFNKRMNYLNTFAICSVDKIPYIDNGKAATRTNDPVNMFYCLTFCKKQGLKDNDGNDNYENPKHSIYFHLGKTEKDWFFPSESERDPW